MEVRDNDKEFLSQTLLPYETPQSFDGAPRSVH
jgi:hypothetical protein